ncbi:MAG: phosphoribosylformylglycinamidine synthase subunit PurQ, partial [Niameybacter sp.]
FSTYIKRCNDFGAGGVCVAIGEIAEGLIIDLDQVPVKYMGLDGTELAISESQERMAIAIEAQDVDRVIALCEAENLNAVQVAVVTEEKRLIMKWREQEIVNINRVFLDSAGVTQQRAAHVTAPSWCEDTRTLTKENILELLSDLNVASQKGLGLQFDSTIGARSVLMPYGGKNQRTKEVGMVAKIPVIEGETTAATYMTHGFDPYLSEASPFHGSLYAVVESVAKLVALGANYEDTYLSFQEYFERLGEDKTKWGKPVAALLGTLIAQKALGIAAIGGKDSMSGTFENLNVPPTLISFTCNIGDAKYCVSGSFKAAGNKVVYVHIPVGEDKVPDFETMKNVYANVHRLMKEQKVTSSYAIGKGGLVAALSQMAIGNDLGAKVNTETLQVGAFEAAYGDLVLEVSEAVASTLTGEAFTVIGETVAAQVLSINQVEVRLDDVKTALDVPLSKVFTTEAENELEEKDATYSEKPNLYIAKHKIAVPKVVIPVFPGTNCEEDTARAFRKAGADVEQVLFLNRTPEAIDASLNRMAEAIGEAQILAFPGGFSAGDEPDGSAKFIAAAFRNERLQEAVMKHLYEQDGLALGICNGFQVLVKLGLLPYGEICEMDEHKPTLTYNTIGKHISLLAKTKITSVASPWLSNVQVGEQYEMPLSHGEGRFVAPQAVLDELVKNGQIFSQYVDASGYPSKAGSVNVNGSLYNIEGLVSRDGRIIGKMGHSERVGECVHINIPGNKDQKLFQAGVDYFK